jgi:hypothetical protein
MGRFGAWHACQCRCLPTASCSAGTPEGRGVGCAGRAECDSSVSVAATALLPGIMRMACMNNLLQEAVHYNPRAQVYVVPCQTAARNCFSCAYHLNVKGSICAAACAIPCVTRCCCCNNTCSDGRDLHAHLCGAMFDSRSRQCIAFVTSFHGIFMANGCAAEVAALSAQLLGWIKFSGQQSCIHTLAWTLSSLV